MGRPQTRRNSPAFLGGAFRKTGRFAWRTEYLFEDRAVAMPIVWIKHWGAGRVFCSSPGHDPAEFTAFPRVKQMILRGSLWAAGQL